MSTLKLFWVSLTHKTDNRVIRALKLEWLILTIVTIIGLLIGFLTGPRPVIEILNFGTFFLVFFSMYLFLRTDIFVPEKDEENYISDYNKEKKYAYPLYKLTISAIFIIFSLVVGLRIFFSET